ncbi:MAG: DUF4249 domain-containing protein [Bacteroidales bacterium]|nr:DUF4249 domain-containing protein [Bacteroidales bacterium]MDE6148196.1 DUF4249 domain-containing protein [Bacteroidales bacterium]
MPCGDKAGRLYVECFPASGTDTTFVKIVATKPLCKDAQFTALTGLEVDFYVNGVPCRLETCSTGARKSVLYTVCQLTEGDEVSVSVAADGYPSVSSRSVVPGGPSFGLERELLGNNIRHRLSFVSPGDGCKHYYGAKIHGTLTYNSVSWSSGAPEYAVTEIPRDLPLEAYNPSVSFGDDIVGMKTIVTRDVNGGMMAIFEDGGAQYDKLDVFIDVPYLSDRYDFTSLTDTVVRRCHYNVEVFSIAPEAYRFLNPQINYSLLAAGLVPPFMSSGNIDGGYGMLSCMGRSDSGLLKNLDPIP